MTKTRSSASQTLLFQSALAIAAAIGLSASAFADETSDVRAGQQLATSVCSPCHVVSRPVGPPFAEIAKGAHATPNALREILRATQSNVSHPYAMPNVELTDRQIDEISAYLATLRTEK